MLACCVQKNYTVIKYKDLEEYIMLSVAICEDNVPVQSQLENYIHELYSSCPVEGKALRFQDGKEHPPVYDYRKCIRCFCCQEMCPYGAIRVK